MLPEAMVRGGLGIAARAVDVVVSELAVARNIRAGLLSVVSAAELHLFSVGLMAAGIDYELFVLVEPVVMKVKVALLRRI